MSKEKFDKKLIKLLESNPDFVDKAGSLHRANVRERAGKLDPDLIKLLLTNKEVEAKFFKEIEGRWIFDSNTFVDYITDKNFFADSYTKFRKKIGLNIDGKYLRERGEVALVWPYKDCVLEGGQTKEKEKNRKEIFFNEILAADEINRIFDPKVLTNWKRYTVTGEQEVTNIQCDQDGLIRENLIIKGNNLIALHTLKEQFREKVKLIYIDPPYNTGNDSFGYNDSFNHSTWLTFEKNRLEAAKYFLSNSGSIWISIDEREFAYLKVLCDEIFGRENHISTVTVKVKDPAGVGQQAPIFDICEYLLVYAKDIKQFKENLPEFIDTSHFTEKANGYRNLIVEYGKPRLVKEIERQNVGLVKIYECEDYKISDANKLPFDEYVEKRNSIAADYNPSGGMICTAPGNSGHSLNQDCGRI
ncbi:site-specific DNA-methyltransferase, partial [Candidatus Poribacteria bacterium]|nr:site-specific DNA-methyltransferase [Candidatus Poribacteria bacterium]